MEAIAQSVHDVLVAAEVALPVLPSEGQHFDPRRRRVHPIATVNEQRERGGGADGRIVVGQCFLVRVRILRRQSKDRIRSEVRGLPRKVHCDCAIEASTTDHGNLAVDFIDDRLHHLAVLGRRKRVHLAGTPGCNDGRNRVLEKTAYILAQPGKVQGKIRMKGCDRKRDCTLKPGTKFVGFHLVRMCEGSG